MLMHQAFEAVQWVFLLYFAGINGGYILLNLLTFLSLPRIMQRRVLVSLPRPYTEFEPPISLVVAAYDEEAVIVSSIRSLLQIDYPQFEIVVVNDGSKDGTLRALIDEFDLIEFPEAFRQRLPHSPVRAIYRSKRYPELRVVDKENGGAKADAVNAGVNAARFPLVCPLDADTILQRDSIRLLVQPFLEDPTTVAVGGIVRLANGCEVAGGFLGRVGLPRNPLVLFQVVEYLRAFLFGRLGWIMIDALPLISGAFGLFHKETVIKVGGYNRACLGEDMDLVLRMHRHFRLAGIPYRITFSADPICWTEAPEDLRTLRNQRVRWQHGLLQCMSLYRDLLFHRKSGWLGWLALPFVFFFEGLGPLIEVFGFIIIVAGFAAGWMAPDGFLVIMAVAIGLGTVLSLTSLLLDEIAFHTYPRMRHVLVLILAALFENLGYRQLLAWWRVVGLWRWMRGKEIGWGAMVRTGSWQQGQAGSHAQQAAAAGAAARARPVAASVGDVAIMRTSA